MNIYVEYIENKLAKRKALTCIPTKANKKQIELNGEHSNNLLHNF